MKFIKKHKVGVIMLTVFLVLLIIVTIILFSIIDLDTSKSIFGNRFKDLDKHKISNQDITEIKDHLSSSDKIEKVEQVTRGRLISFIIYVKPSTDKASAKGLTKTILDSFDTGIKAYYDIEVLITETKLTKDSIYPIIGYKHKTSPDFIWTNN